MGPTANWCEKTSENYTFVKKFLAASQNSFAPSSPKMADITLIFYDSLGIIEFFRTSFWLSQKEFLKLCFLSFDVCRETWTK